MPVLPEPHYFNLEYIYYKIYLFVVNFGTAQATFFTDRFMMMVKIYSFLITLFLAAVVVYLTKGIFEIRQAEIKKLYSSAEIVGGDDKKVTNPHWDKVQKYIESNNESDWRLAVIEADIMLGEMLGAFGYQGEGIGEKLKSVEAGDFLTLNDAWEAHKYRNDIAHTPGFVVTQREARRIIDLFRKVFDEFEYI